MIYLFMNLTALVWRTIIIIHIIINSLIIRTSKLVSLIEVRLGSFNILKYQNGTTDLKRVPL